MFDPSGYAAPPGDAASTPRPMKIIFKLYASLAQYLPTEARYNNRVPMEVSEGTTIAQVIEPYGLPPALVHLVLINGVYVPPAERLTRVLVDGDVLAIWPPIAGG
jgi:sulfur carrier protein ThiS